MSEFTMHLVVLMAPCVLMAACLVTAHMHINLQKCIRRYNLHLNSILLLNSLVNDATKIRIILSFETVAESYKGTTMEEMLELR